MDAVEILLMGVVGLSVLVFLILDNLYHDQALKQSVGGGGHAEKQAAAAAAAAAGACGVLERESFGERDEREGADDPVNARCGGSERRMSEDEFVDDWEGVERSELEKTFGEAIVFANSKKRNGGGGGGGGDGGGGGIGEDVMLELYGLQKVALQGPCHVSQPMALNLSARSKWNAWRKLGDMSEEMAMEKYIGILSSAIPNWNVNENLRCKGENLTSDPHENIEGVEDER